MTVTEAIATGDRRKVLDTTASRSQVISKVKNTLSHNDIQEVIVIFPDESIERVKK